MKLADLRRQITQGNRLHKIKIFTREITSDTVALGVRSGTKRTTLGLPTIHLDSKGMTADEAVVIRQAMAKRDELEATLDSEGLAAVKTIQAKGRSKVSEIMDEWANTFTVKQTQMNCGVVKSYFLAAIGDIKVGSVRRDHLATMMEYMRKEGKHPNYVRYQASRMRAFCNWADQRGYMPRVDTRKLLPPELFGEVKALTPEELSKLAATPIQHFQDVKDRFLLGVYTAQRLGELSKYTFAILEDGQISVQQGKTGKRIVVPLSAPAIALLKRVRDRAKDKTRDALVFQELPAEPTARRWFNRWLTAAGIDSKRVSLKNSRSTAISLLINSGVPQDVAQELANHSSPVTTAKYYRQVDTNRKKAAVAVIPDFSANS